MRTLDLGGAFAWHATFIAAGQQVVALCRPHSLAWKVTDLLAS